MEKIILASASPRRKEILKNIGIEFETIISNADEDSIPKTLESSTYAQELALLKASDVFGNLQAKEKKDKLILSADTIVVLDEEILGKPKDEEDAKMILRKLSGREHKVITGVCVMRTNDAYCVCKSNTTYVKFRNLDEEEIISYIKTGEPMDKAGAYGIQQKGAIFVEEIKGDYTNVVGLPVSVLYNILKNDFNYVI